MPNGCLLSQSKRALMSGTKMEARSQKVGFYPGLCGAVGGRLGILLVEIRPGYCLQHLVFELLYFHASSSS